MSFEELKYKANSIMPYVRNAAVLLILAIGIYFFIKSVTRNIEEVKIAKVDSSRSITQITQPTIHTIEYVPMPYNTTDSFLKETVIVPDKYKPSEDIAELKKQVSELSNRLFRYNKYRDSIRLRDTSGLDVGIVNIEDSITQNAIASRKVDYTLKFPRETITINNTLAAKKVTQVYIGPELNVIPSGTLFNQAGVSAILKTKSDVLYKAGAGFQFGLPTTKPYFSIGYYPKISFKK